MKQTIRALLWMVLIASLVSLPSWYILNKGEQRTTSSLRELPVQDGGRVKPLESFARETLSLIYGSESFLTEDGERRPALEIVLTWMLVPQYWDQQKIVEVNHKGLKTTLKMNDEVKRFSPAEILSNERLSLVMQELAAYRETKKKLTPYYQAAQRLETQLGMYQAVRNGVALRVVPRPPTEEESKTEEDHQALANARSTSWLTIAELTGDLQGRFSQVMRAFIRALPAEKNSSMPSEKEKAELADQGKSAVAPSEANEKAVPPADEVLGIERANSKLALERAVLEFMTLAREQNPAAYGDAKHMQGEVEFKVLHPFGLTWVLYLLAALILALAWQSEKPLIYQLGWVFALAAFVMHSYGFGLRMYLTGRPPVSNMYESVVWVSWGAIVFAMVFEFIYRRYFILLAGAVVGVLCLIVADLAPTILDSSIQPLEPVLRSNMWLTVHVLTITLGYSAFFLAWGLGIIGLTFILFGQKSTAEKPRMVAQSVYRTLQVGVVLLAAGTILGGVWADYSWGRFWGWDPKETWAFIALLGYLALLHGRLVGMFQNFGMMVGAIVSFDLVLMAWYGVNFVLGAGLHSYGFGAGGVQYMAAFVILNLIYVFYVMAIFWHRKNREKIAA